MSGVQIEVTLQGIERVQAALGRLATTDLEYLVHEVGEYLTNSTKDRMDHGVAPDGSPWQPWSATYAATRHDGHSLLISSMSLQESIGNISSGLVASVGAHMIYAAIHQTGGKAGRGHKVTIPARPYLGLSDADRDAVEALVIGTLEGRLQ